MTKKGYKQTEEHKRKLLETKKGRKYPKEKYPNHGMRNKHPSEEAKEKNRLKHLGKYVGEKHPMYGKHHSEETKIKMSLAHKGYKHSEETKIKMSLARKGKTFEEIYGEEKAKKYKEKRCGLSRSEETKRKIGLGNKGKIRTKEMRIKMSEANKGENNYWYGKTGKKNPMYGKIQSKEARRKISNGNKGKIRSVEAKKRYSKAQKKLWQDEEYTKKMFKAFKIKPNKPEKFMINLIEQNNFPFIYTGDGKFWIEGFNPDFICNPSKKIIELFGDYWHNKESAKERDVLRLKVYKKYGFQTLVIWEHELENPIQILNKIKEFIK